MRIYILAVILLLFTACKNSEQVFQTDIEIPTRYSSDSQLIRIDSIRQKDTLKTPKYSSFFNDSILVALIDSSLVNNRDVLLAYARIQQTKAGIAFTKGIRLPDLNLAISSGVRKFGDYTIDGVGNYDTQFSPNLTAAQQIPNPVPDYYVGVYSTWEIDIWKKLKNKKRAALLRYLASEQGRNLVIIDLVSAVAKNYYSLLILDRELKIIQESIELQENALQLIKAQMENGKTNELAVQLMTAQVLESKSMKLEVAQDIIRNENELNVLLGRYPETIERSELSTVITKVSGVSTTVPSELLAKRPDILQAENNLKAARADVKSAKAAFYPTLQLSGSLGLQSFRLAFLLDSPSSFAFNLTNGLVMPLLNRRALKAELMDAKGKQLEAYLNYEKTILNAMTEVYGLLQLKENLEQMQQIKTAEVTILQASVTTANDLYLSGRSSYLEIITAQNYYLQRQLEALQVQLRNFNNQIQLYKAIGGGLK
jgi:NodT family efflux transporter outer membrane factor (OMF) lipoprotein